MKKLTLPGVVATLCLYTTAMHAQSNAQDLYTINTPLYVDNWIKPEVNMGQFYNYKDRTATFASFKNKLLVLGFWFTNCSACIAQFPKEDSLQSLYDKDIQIILVTFEPLEKVAPFIKKWESLHHTTFNLPIIVADTLLTKSFHVKYNPHYLWIAPGGKLIAQTSEHFMNAGMIQSLLPDIAYYRNFMEQRERKPKKTKSSTL